MIRRGDSRDVITGGVTDTRSKDPVTEQDRFFIGSVSKTVLAAAVLRLVQRHQLGLNDTVDQWLPGLLRDGDQITVQQLLSHTSGLANFTDHPGLFAPGGTKPSTPTQLVDLAESMPREFRPGTGASYSNTNFVVLGLIVEKMTGRPLATVLHDEVFGPLRLTSATADLSHALDPPLVHAYRGRRDTTPPNWVLPLLWGAGEVMMMSPRDLDTFLHSLFDGALLSPASVQQMTAKQSHLDEERLDYGLGLGELDSGCGLAYGHGGDVPGGYSTEAWTIPDQHRSVVVTVNADDITAHTDANFIVQTALCG